MALTSMLQRAGYVLYRALVFKFESKKRWHRSLWLVVLRSVILLLEFVEGNLAIVFTIST